MSKKGQMGPKEKWRWKKLRQPGKRNIIMTLLSKMKDVW